MSKIEFETTNLKGLRLIRPFYAPDCRGFFIKGFEKNIYNEAGLHFQRCHSQDKLVQVLHGAVYDIAVDLRKNSPTFGQWEGFYLSAENRQMLYIPKGFAHGFLALEDDTLFSYLCGDRYDSPSDGGILWSDPQLAVRWPTERVEKVILSDKDAALPTLSEFMSQYGGLPDTEEKV